MINEIKRQIEELEASYLSVGCLAKSRWEEYRQYFMYAIKYSDYVYSATPPKNLPVEASQLLSQINVSLRKIKSSFIATTATGVFLHFLGEDRFPEELFEYSDEALCRIFYHNNEGNNSSNQRSFYLAFGADSQKRRFYFSPPEALDQASIHGGEVVLNEKERIFRFLKANISINGIARNLVFRLDQDWLDVVRNGDRK